MFLTGYIKIMQFLIISEILNNLQIVLTQFQHLKIDKSFQSLYFFNKIVLQSKNLNFSECRKSLDFINMVIGKVKVLNGGYFFHFLFWELSNLLSLKLQQCDLVQWCLVCGFGQFLTRNTLSHQGLSENLLWVLLDSYLLELFLVFLFL